MGDTICYPDGSKSHIATGSVALKFEDRVLTPAIVGSTADNGDTIVDSRQSRIQYVEYMEVADEDLSGLSQPGNA